MARGWESKAVEEQQAQAATPPDKIKPRLTPAERVLQAQRDGLLLSRKRLLQQLETTQNPRYREMLQAALADLDSRLAQLG